MHVILPLYTVICDLLGIPASIRLLQSTYVPILILYGPEAWTLKNNPDDELDLFAHDAGGVLYFISSVHTMHYLSEGT